LPINVDYDKVVKTKGFREEIRAEEDLPDAILDLINSQYDTTLTFSS
jgi:hypothetical protein